MSKDDLFRQSDTLTIHLELGDRSRGLVGADELALMKQTSWLVNTSRGPIVDEAALDVFDTEPLPVDHPLRSLPNALVTPHIGYVAENLYRTFFGDVVASITEWLAAASH